MAVDVSMSSHWAVGLSSLSSTRVLQCSPFISSPLHAAAISTPQVPTCCPPNHLSHSLPRPRSALLRRLVLAGAADEASAPRLLLAPCKTVHCPVLTPAGLLQAYYLPLVASWPAIPSFFSSPPPRCVLQCSEPRQAIPSSSSPVPPHLCSPLLPLPPSPLTLTTPPSSPTDSLPSSLFPAPAHPPLQP